MAVGLWVVVTNKITGEYDKGGWRIEVRNMGDDTFEVFVGVNPV